MSLPTNLNLYLSPFNYVNLDLNIICKRFAYFWILLHNLPGRSASLKVKHLFNEVTQCKTGHWDLRELQQTFL